MRDNNYKIHNKILYQFVKTEKKSVFVVAIISLVAAIISTLNIAVLIPVVNFSINENQSELINIINNIFGEKDIFIILIIIFLTISLISFMMEIVVKIYGQRLTNKIILNNESNIFDKLIRLNYSFYSRNKQGEITYVTTIAPQSLAWIIQAVIDIIQAAIMISLYVLLLFSLSFVGTLILSVIAVIYYVCISKYVNKTVAEAGESRAKFKQNKNVVINEFLTGIKTIKVNDAEKLWEKKYIDILNKELKEYYRMIIFQRLPESIINFLGFFIIGLLALALYIYYNGNINEFIGIFSAFGMTLYKLLPMLKRINSSKLVLAQYYPDMIKVHDLMTIKDERRKNDGRELTTFYKSIKVNDLTFRYDESTEEVLKNITVSFNKNEFTALVGYSGSGKSTLINLIMKLYTVPNNTIFIDDVDINEYSIETIVDKISYVAQDIFLINDTVENNIKFGLDNVSIDEVVQAAKIADAHEFIINLDKGYKTITGDLGSMLSGGQKQKIAIARAILRNKKIIILDEATSALDNISERKLRKSLSKLASNTTLIVIAHRLPTIENASKIIVMNNGEIEECGNHDELMQTKGMYYDLYINQRESQERN